MPPRLLFPALFALTLSAAEPFPVRVDVHANKRLAPLKPLWAFFGYDEPNYTYMKDGRRLLSQLAALSPVPVYVRAHNLLTTGDGTPALKWGSTNAYTLDAAGRPHYDWTLTDRIFDTYVERGMKPLVEIGFMPEALSSKPTPYRHNWKPEQPGSSIAAGWAYPPSDYGKWRDLVYEWVKHCVARYGKAEVESWYWEVWNEPDIVYWQGTQEEYFKLYDFAADGLKKALPTARIGGPHSTGPASPRAGAWLQRFLEHALRGRNEATGAIGSPLDYIGFHAKGRPKVEGDHVRMGIQYQLSDIDAGLRIVSSFPELRSKPIIIGESDPEGCAACPARFHPQNAYRNGTVYSSYTAASFARKYDLAERRSANLTGAVTWAFEFEDQPWFDGFRDLATNGIEKPVLNVFRMFGLMHPERVHAQSSAQVPLDEILTAGVRNSPDVGVLATRGDRSLELLLWHYHDDDLPGPEALVNLHVDGLAPGRLLLKQYRVDSESSNSYSLWQGLGRPQNPDRNQIERLQKSAALTETISPEWLNSSPAGLNTNLRLPRQAVVLLVFQW